MPTTPASLLERMGAALRPAGLCELCALPSRQTLCKPCTGQYLGGIEPRCSHCGLALAAGGFTCGACLRSPPPYIRTLTLGDYGVPIDRLIQRLKFGNEPAIGHWLGQLLAAHWRAAGHPLPGLVLPIPLSPSRLQQRGYNQAWEMARTFARELRVAARSDVLMRVREMPPQSSLPLALRTKNVRGVFAAPGRLKAQHVVLIDDVMTTGSTLGEAASVLQRAGAAEVSVAVALRTPPPG
ncbi:putative PRTase-like [Thiomonas sp. X19]|uniref:ComF family protein n=1 Tax=Thiomonas sp. X19 TaxID=1050370 RepID=UPI000B6356BA|nr:ComF family protein [Thiomonas sp. X19]SCC92172.1 putative PRTase-like [Thiomonas sp. X19]